jgi:hypothetical protein
VRLLAFQRPESPAWTLIHVFVGLVIYRAVPVLTRLVCV